MAVYLPLLSGTTMKIVCSAIGPSALSFSWTKEHVTLQPSYRVKIEVNSNSSTLFIRNTDRVDTGNYTCKIRYDKDGLSVHKQ